MNLGDIFPPSGIKLNIASGSKSTALNELASTLAEIHPELDRNTILMAVEDREDKMNTCVGSGVAVPHGYYPGIDGIFGVLGISDQGVAYGALGDKPVHCIFMLIFGEGSKEKHLRVLNRIMTLIEYDGIPLIREAKSVNEIHHLLSRTGSSLGGI
ncbi:MAG: PTS sugar transporter subunit IIA [Spirochaetaceae bacterium]|jgi:mannitol/fructose-specific phosphotransferase system IIA component (Ntr-type)|nr:PTS sugar transporter subunit IIA [Spirochaetaceae bacterium]